MDLKSFSKFLGHHANDLDSLAEAIKLITLLLPIQPQDKANVIAAVDNIENAATNIRHSIARVKDAVTDGKKAVGAVKPKKAALKPVATAPKTNTTTGDK